MQPQEKQQLASFGADARRRVAAEVHCNVSAVCLACHDKGQNLPTLRVFHPRCLAKKGKPTGNMNLSACMPHLKCCKWVKTTEIMQTDK